MRFKNRLSDDQYRELHHTINEARKGSKVTKFDIAAVQALLYDYEDLLTEYQGDIAHRRKNFVHLDPEG